MTRTDQYLDGYDSCRQALQSILMEYPQLQNYYKLYELAIYPYYKEDGQDWHPLCHNCKYWDMDMDYNYGCVKNNVKNIKDEICKVRVEKEEVKEKK